MKGLGMRAGGHGIMSRKRYVATKKKYPILWNPIINAAKIFRSEETEVIERGKDMERKLKRSAREENLKTKKMW